MNETSTETAPPKLRSKAPYTCRATKNETGKYCAAILTEADVYNLCPACEKDLRENPPQTELKPLPRAETPDTDIQPKPHWPFWPGA